MDNPIIPLGIYILGVIMTFISMLSMSDRWYFALIKAIFWPIFWIIVFFHRAGVNDD